MTDNQDSTVVESVTGGASSSGEPGGIVQETRDKHGNIILRGEGGAFLPGQRIGRPITSANAHDMQEARKQATARKIREELSRRSGGAKPSAAVALAAGDLWEQVVMSKDANPRYRYDTWRGLASAAELLADRRESVTGEGVTVQIGADLARELVAALLQSRKDAE